MEESNNTPIIIDIFKTAGKYNESVTLTDDDVNAGARILCKEPYAQELYDIYCDHHNSYDRDLSYSKDLTTGAVYEVIATTISFDDKEIYAEEVNTRTQVIIPFKEFEASIDELAKGDDLGFSVMILKSTDDGVFLGSERKCRSINYKKELFKHMEDNTWFEVKISKLIRGGYIALYKNNVECFIPGSHAGANVIRDFSSLLGKTLNVMVDNYDTSNDLLILSYKKYIKKSMPNMVTNLKFGHRYTGTLTNKPYDFGVFVEIEGYYTGLVHSSEFEDYDTIKKTLKAGDEIDIYIKNVTRKGKDYRIVLTLDEEEIDSEKREWDALRTRTENRSFDYEVDSRNNSINIDIDGSSYKVTLRRKDLERNLNSYPKVKVFKVDPINKSLRFEFVEDED